MDEEEYKAKLFEIKTELPDGHLDYKLFEDEWFKHYPAVAIRNQKLLTWCGYIGVHQNHPWNTPGTSPEEADSVAHGGLTYQRDELPDKHVYKLSKSLPRDRVWFGFDCAHMDDDIPCLRAFPAPPPEGVYKDIDFVEQVLVGMAKAAALSDKVIKE